MRNPEETTSPTPPQIIEHFCCHDDLSTYDPYDVWKTPVGFLLKNLFDTNRLLGFLPAAVATLADTFVNNRLRLFYSKQEYPIVRAMAALSLLNLHGATGNTTYLDYARKHLQWLADHSCTGFKGTGWGLGFHYAAGGGVTYKANTPLATITPYALEAFAKYSSLTDDSRFLPVIAGIHDFFDKDILVMKETDDWMATSYAPMKDRIVTNAASYAMYSYALLLPYLAGDAKEKAIQRINKLRAFIRHNQRSDGSWLYSPEGRSFIDCFHTCIVLKNLFKTSQLVACQDSADMIARGYAYLKESMLDVRTGLFHRFSLQNKPSIVKCDLYDNAEALNLARILGDTGLVTSLLGAIDSHFRQGLDIYSQVDALGVRRNKNMLRWAVMPYVYALSKLVQA